mgnify:CR=1 FL=1
MTGPFALSGAAPLAATFVAGGLVLQAYLAGLAVFGAATGWSAHAVFGSLLAIPIAGLAVLAWLSPGARSYRRPASLLFVLYLVQFGLAGVGASGGAAWIAALHPANALLMLIVTLGMARRVATAPA